MIAAGREHSGPECRALSWDFLYFIHHLPWWLIRRQAGSHEGGRVDGAGHTRAQCTHYAAAHPAPLRPRPPSEPRGKSTLSKVLRDRHRHPGTCPSRIPRCDPPARNRAWREQQGTEPRSVLLMCEWEKPSEHVEGENYPHRPAVSHRRWAPSSFSPSWPFSRRRKCWPPFRVGSTLSQPPRALQSGRPSSPATSHRLTVGPLPHLVPRHSPQ